MEAKRHCMYTQLSALYILCRYAKYDHEFEIAYFSFYHIIWLVKRLLFILCWCFSVLSAWLFVFFNALQRIRPAIWLELYATTAIRGSSSALLSTLNILCVEVKEKQKLSVVQWLVLLKSAWRDQYSPITP